MPDQINNPVLDNLENSEAKLQQVNGQLDSLLSEYHKVSTDVGDSSFFNLDNIYFWLVLIGLVLLAFGLWFLMTELKYYSSRQRLKKSQPSREEVPTIRTVIKEQKKQAVKNSSQPKRKKPVKIKVVKVK